MPTKPKRPCTHPMCPNLTMERYCTDHANKAKQERSERNKHYDRYQRDQKADKFYKSKEWERTRRQALMRDHGLCQDCLLEKQVTPADMVHHIKPLKLFWHLRLVLSNLISLCNACHAKIDHKNKVSST